MFAILQVHVRGQQQYPDEEPRPLAVLRENVIKTDECVSLSMTRMLYNRYNK